MVMVINPFFSGWASGSIAKTITCRAMGHQRFCMHKFRHTQHKRSEKQIFWQERFKRKAWLARDFRQISWGRSAILNRARCGIANCGANNMVCMHLNEILPCIAREA